MTDIINWVVEKFKEHPEKQNMTYTEHLFQALKISGISFLGSILLATHAVFPFLFEGQGGDLISLASNQIYNIRKLGTPCTVADTAAGATDSDTEDSTQQK